MREIKVIELFAGVGGFRIGLEGWKGKSALSGYNMELNSPYKVVWSNQWEPSTKIQHASSVYETRFGKEGHINDDISKIAVSDIPDHDLLVGGFPCQDYSVARTLSQSAGLVGKKGVLWWEIHRILKEKGNKAPKYLLLENVDRLLKSPVKQRGRDFAIMLSSLASLGYYVEWRVINAAEYGMPQKRRRTFILAYHKSTEIAKQMKKSKSLVWIKENGVFARAFEVMNEHKGLNESFLLDKDLEKISLDFNKSGFDSPFYNSGIMIDFKVTSIGTKSNFEGPFSNLGDVLININEVNPDYFIDENTLDKWKYFKGAKKEPRNKANGISFFYTEGPLPFPDPLDKPARTIITSEGGKTPSRFKHVVKQGGKYRRLTPIELERINMFPDNHTKGVSDTKRAFFMGNALVIGIVEKLGIELSICINDFQYNNKLAQIPL